MNLGIGCGLAEKLTLEPSNSGHNVSFMSYSALRGVESLLRAGGIAPKTHKQWTWRSACVM